MQHRPYLMSPAEMEMMDLDTLARERQALVAELRRQADANNQPLIANCLERIDTINREMVRRAGTSPELPHLLPQL